MPCLFPKMASLTDWRIQEREWVKHLWGVWRLSAPSVESQRQTARGCKRSLLIRVSFQPWWRQWCWICVFATSNKLTSPPIIRARVHQWAADSHKTSHRTLSLRLVAAIRTTYSSPSGYSMWKIPICFESPLALQILHNHDMLGTSYPSACEPSILFTLLYSIRITTSFHSIQKPWSFTEHSKATLHSTQTCCKFILLCRSDLNSAHLSSSDNEISTLGPLGSSSPSRHSTWNNNKT